MSRHSIARNLIFLSMLLILSARGWSQSPARTRIAEISSAKFTEFAPTISADGKTLIFESNKNKSRVEGDHWELFESRLDEKGVWSEPYPLTAINEKCNFLAGPSLSYDGNTIYFTAFIEGLTTSEDIFYSTRLNDRNWSAPISIGAPINTDGYEGFPSVAANGNSLYFLRVNEANEFDKKNKENCFSIYVSHKQPDGSWGDPMPLPASINAGCERDPKIMADSHTLIFSSIRVGNKGKFDMYQSRLQQDGSWSDPQPLDFINSAENDLSPCIPAAGDVIYFCSTNDIYSTSIPKEYRQLINIHIQGIVRTADSKAPIATEIRVINTLTNEVMTTFKNNAANGHYSLILGSLNPYRVDFFHESYFIAHADFDFRSQESYKEIEHNVELIADYTLKLDIKDKDLGFGLNSFLSLKDNTGKLVYNDSVRRSDLPLALKLKATNQYTISVNAPLYAAKNNTLTFDASSFRAEMPYEITLEHDKIKFATAVTDVSTKQRLKTKVHYNNEDKDEVIIAEEGEAVYLRKGDRYQVVTSSDKGYLFSSASIVAGDGPAENGTYALDLTVAPVKVGANLTLNHITFPSNSADLKQSSFVELDQVIDLLTNNPGMSIEISAHTDDVGNDEYNNSLSEKRAQSVLEYLKKKKISSQRIVAKGYGETKPVAPNDSEINRELNRRVELAILKVD
jgi:outer membrane protein OmpA-like peptidoglycan-associated protein/Tol biopolymer transport system component